MRYAVLTRTEIDDWEEVLASHDDSDPFHTELIEVPMT